MKTIFFVLFILLYSPIQAQTGRSNPFKMVQVPDSIALKLEISYKRSTDIDSANAGRNVWNLLKPKQFTFQNGIYTFKGQGPHFPRRLFIFNDCKLFIFSSNDVTSVLSEYLNSFAIINLPDDKKIDYLGAITKYLKDEETQ